MNKTLAKNILRTSAFALACLALAGADVKAQLTATGVSSVSTSPTMATATPLETYSTAGSIGTTGVTNSGSYTGPGPVEFSSVTTGSFGLNSNVSLGGFTVSTISDGSTTTYNNTPFTITYNPLAVNSVNFGNTPITITGVLNGSVNGNTSSVVATFNTINSPVFQTADGTFLSTISVANNPLSLVPSTSFGGLTSIQASVITTASSLPPSGGTGGVTPTPEPTTLAILATSLVGLGLRQRLRKGRPTA
jgi:hypothetical protein